MAPLRKPGIFLLTLLFGLLQLANSQDVRITEFLAVNTKGISDDDKTLQGWIELWNPSNSASVNLGSWKLRHMGVEWVFPTVQLPPKDRILIWASGKDRKVAAAPLHTNFTLNAAGGEGVSLELIRSNATTASVYTNYPAQTADISFGRDDGDVTQVGYYEKPTPGAENNYEGTGVSGDVVFSRQSEAFNSSFQLQLSQEVPVEGAVIRYTTDRSIPTSSSPVYTGPIAVVGTTMVRARVFEPGKLPGEPEARCFLLVDASSVNFNAGMPIVVMTNFGAGTPVDGNSVPVENGGYMWVFEKGTDGRARLTSPPNIAVRIAMDRRGSSTLGNPKFNLNVETRKDRGDFEKDVPLLGMPTHSDWVFHAPYDFDRALLRNIFMYSLSNQVGRYAPRGKLAEVFVDINGGPLSFTNSASGDYYGVYNVFEKIRRGKDRINIAKLDRYDNDAVSKTGGYIWKVDRRDTGDLGFSTSHESLLAYYYPKEVDIITTQRDFQEQYLRSYMQQMDAASFGANFKHPTLGFRGYVDEAAAIDHHLLNVWPMNVDAMRLSGYMYKDRGGKIIYGPIWDFDRSMDSTDGRDDSPTTWRSQVSDFGTDFFNYTWWNRWFSDIDFYQAYIDRWVALRAGNGPFSAASVNALLDDLNSQITAEAIQRDLIRWQRTKRNWTSPFTGTLYTGQTAEVQRIKDWLQQRANWMETQWVGKVSMSPAGGNFTQPTEITLSGPANATIYYTTDGTDPRPAGGAAPTGENVKIYTGPFTVTSTMRVRARAYNPAHTALSGANNPPLVSKWSGRTDARFAFEAPAGAGTLAVTEVNYHPADPTTAELAVNPQFTDADFEFIEFRNIGTAPIDLGNASFTSGISFSFTGDNALSIGPGQYVIVAANPTAFALRYGAKPNVVGPYTGDLSNAGERITLVSATAQPIVDFTYSDTWYPTTDGGGTTLVSYNFNADPAEFSTAGNWRPSASAGGTPGAADGPFAATLDATEVTINSAQLNGIVSTNGVATTVSFKVGDVSYPLDPIPAGSGVVTVTKALTGLLPHTTYTARIEATDGTSLTVANSVEFTTLNRDPSAIDKALHVVGRAPFEVDVLAGATDPDGDTLTVESVTQGQHGVVTIEAGKVIYTPGDSYTGNDTFTFTLDDGFGGSATATVTLQNVAPMAVADSIISGGQPVSFDARANDVAGDADPLTVSAVSDASYGTVTINAEGLVVYTPGLLYPGADMFSYTVSDGTAQSTATVTVRSTVPVFLGGLIVGSPVPGQPSGTTYAEVGLPNSGVISGKVKSPDGKQQAAIFKADGTVQLRVGESAPLIPGATISKLGNLTGHAVIATLKGSGVSKGNDTVVYADLDSTPRIIAREGDALVPGTKVKQFISVDGNGSTVFLLVKLAGGGVKAANDLAVAAAPAGANASVILREGGTLEGQVVAQLGTLVSSKFTLAEGRWRLNSETIGIRATLPGKVQALYAIRAHSAGVDAPVLWAKTSELDLGGSSAKKLGLPGYSPDGVAYNTQLARVPRTVTASNDAVLLRATDEGTAILATKGSAAPGANGQAIPGVNFGKFSDPVAGSEKRTAFLGTLVGSGVNDTNQTGIWYFDGSADLRLLARAGDPVQGGGTWLKFESLALPNGAQSGPIFTAKTSLRDRGLWAVDSTGALTELIRTGKSLTVSGTARTVESFVALSPLPGANGVASGYTDNQQVSAIVTFVGGGEMLVNVVVP